MFDQVNVVGLRELRKALKELDPKWPKGLREVNKRAAEVVVPEARTRASQVRTNVKGNPTRAGSAVVGSIRALASQTRAQVAMGGARLPHAGGFDWGSSGRFKQFPAANKEGYILWPAAKAKEEVIVAYYLKMLDDLTQDAFPE